MTTIDSFIKKYTKEIIEENAAIFAGAGLSVSAGYVTWKELLREIAEELQLDIDKEQDLVAIAQYHLNENKNRSGLNQRIIEKFTSDAAENEVHNILARLPIKTYWTTNYDSIIEEVLKKHKKKVDVKIEQKCLANNVPRRDTVVYKMHGDVLMPGDAVITKDDYEAYNEKHQLFSTALQGDLVSKTFLFIGFSFEDPNLSYVLSRIRILLGENKRTHYAFMKKCKRSDYKTNEEFVYANTKQKLRIEDLKRYSIIAVIIDEYSEIEEILSKIERSLNLKNIFISGSAHNYGDWDEIKSIELITKITESLLKQDLKIVTGFGLGVGSFVINTAVQVIDESKYSHYNDYLKINPFPFQLSAEQKSEFNKKYRNKILSQCGIAIFLFGNKIVEEKVMVADGVIEEYRIAREKDIAVIPIGSTGFASKIINEEIKSELDSFPYLKDTIDILSSSKDVDQIVTAIISTIKIIIGG